jgi:LytS/YehU family sensor histidine kinase
MLYELDQPLVSLKKEIEMMKEYMTLEKIRLGDNLEMEIKTKGDLHDKMIAPFLILPFIENGFKHCSLMPDKCWIILEIEVEETYYLIKLVNGIIPEMAAQAEHENGIANVQKRLNLLYPGKHELKIMAEQEMLVALLKIEFDPHPANITTEIKSAETVNAFTATYA